MLTQINCLKKFQIIAGLCFIFLNCRLSITNMYISILYSILFGYLTAVCIPGAILGVVQGCNCTMIYEFWLVYQPTRFGANFYPQGCEQKYFAASKWKRNGVPVFCWHSGCIELTLLKKTSSDVKSVYEETVSKKISWITYVTRRLERRGIDFRLVTHYIRMGYRVY